MRRARWWRKKIDLTFWARQGTFALVAGVMLLLWCEWIVYYMSLYSSNCAWPQPLATENSATDTSSAFPEQGPLKVLFFSDTHLLGRRNGHWFDRLRREWQMERSFQTIVELYKPQTAILLGDTFDEGKVRTCILECV